MKALFSLFITVAATALSGSSSLPTWAKTEQAIIAPVVITEIVAGQFHDLVLLNGGHDRGLRQGMILQSPLEAEAVARLLVAEASADKAVALIFELPAGRTLQIGGKAYPSVIRL